MPDFSGEMPFVTDEAILACCLITAGCQPYDPQTPCRNIYDEDILFKIGGGQRDNSTKEITRKSRFSGMHLWDAAQEAWKELAKGDVRYEISLTARCADLIKIYRDQCRELIESDESSGSLILKIMQQVGVMPVDEAIMRIACINLKTRGDFVNHWKTMVPVLRVPRKGKAKITDGTAQVQVKGGGFRTVPAKVSTGPGFDALSLNASPEMRRKMGL